MNFIKSWFTRRQKRRAEIRAEIEARLAGEITKGYWLKHPESYVKYLKPGLDRWDELKAGTHRRSGKAHV